MSAVLPAMPSMVLRNEPITEPLTTSIANTTDTPNMIPNNVKNVRPGAARR